MAGIMVNSLGHGWLLHSMLSTIDPSQSLPPCKGAGFVHVLNRFLIPPPHVLLHVPNGVHSDQFPWTEEVKA